MRVLVVDTDLAEDLVRQIALSGEHKVYYFQSWHKSHPELQDLAYCEGILEDLGVEKVNNWWNLIEEMDLIVFSDIGFGDDIDFLRERGYKVFAASKAGEELENDRMLAKKVCKDLGMDIPPTEEMGVTEAIDYVKDQNKAYVIKFSKVRAGNLSTYIPVNTEDCISYLGKAADTDREAKVILEEFVDGIECAVTGYFNGSEFLTPFCINFEHKKMMDGEVGTNTGEQGCYDEQTEVLTKDGWKFWNDVTKEDKLATLVDGVLKYEKPLELVCFNFKGKMIGWKNRSIDLLVTPKHNMYVQKQFPARKNLDNYEFISADNCVQSQYSLKRTARWGGEENFNFKLPTYRFNKGRGSTEHKELKISMLNWARFLGIYIAEGCCSGRQVIIAQSNPKKMGKVKKILSKLPFKVGKQDNGFVISSAQLASHLSKFGGHSYEKFVPQYIKDAGSEVIEAFLDGYGIGDANFQPNNFRIFYTSSKCLANDVQELLLKIGRLGIIKVRADRPVGSVRGKIGDRFIVQKHLAYEVTERPRKMRSWLDARDKYEIDYDGKVYCAVVSSHVLFVRRNGKPVWCGNTLLRYTSENIPFVAYFKKLEPYLKKIGYRGIIDLACIANEDGYWVLEFSCRFGYPISMIQPVLHDEPFADLLYGVANGSLKTFGAKEDLWAVGVCLNLGCYPFDDEVQKTGFLNIYGLEDALEDGCKIGFAAIVKRNGKYFTTPGHGRVLVANGTGNTISEARDKAYRALDYISWSDISYRLDIGMKIDRVLPRLIELGVLPKNAGGAR